MKHLDKLDKFGSKSVATLVAAVMTLSSACKKEGETEAPTTSASAKAEVETDGTEVKADADTTVNGEGETPVAEATEDTPEAETEDAEAAEGTEVEDVEATEEEVEATPPKDEAGEEEPARLSAKLGVNPDSIPIRSVLRHDRGSSMEDPRNYTVQNRSSLALLLACIVDAPQGADAGAEGFEAEPTMSSRTIKTEGGPDRNVLAQTRKFGYDFNRDAGVQSWRFQTVEACEVIDDEAVCEGEIRVQTAGPTGESSARYADEALKICQDATKRINAERGAK